jgi:hypothetical protein
MLFCILQGDLKMNVYIENGYLNRRDYLESLAEDFETDLDTVLMMADILGKSEDFDGLVSHLEDRY